MEIWQQLGVAFALVLVIEGMLPFLSPGRWRRLVEQIAEVDDTMLRGVGLISMLAGVALLYLIN